MNTAQLKSYAPEARLAFIDAVTAQATKLGITAAGNEPARVDGDFLIVAGQAFPKSVRSGRDNLIQQVKETGFARVMDAAAYTWFNRLAAIRYMEIHGFLDHGYRVLSHPDGGTLPQILEQAAKVDLPGLDRDAVVAMKLDGT